MFETNKLQANETMKAISEMPIMVTGWNEQGKALNDVLSAMDLPRTESNVEFAMYMFNVGYMFREREEKIGG